MVVWVSAAAAGLLSSARPQLGLGSASAGQTGEAGDRTCLDLPLGEPGGGIWQSSVCRVRHGAVHEIVGRQVHSTQ